MASIFLTAFMAMTATLPLAPIQQGDRVLSRWQGDEYYFPGVVESIADQAVTVQYDDGDRDTRPADQVKRYDWRVGSPVECNWKNDGSWYSGTISEMNKDALSINYDDGDRENTKTALCRSR